MNIVSLPDEMIASIFKYVNYPTVSRIRRTNTRCNVISKRYGIGTRQPLKMLSCVCEDRKWEFTILPEHIGNIINNRNGKQTYSGYRIKCVEYEMPETLDTILKNVIIMDHFSINVSLRSIDEKLLAWLIRNKEAFRSTKSCRFAESFACSIESIRSLIDHMAELEDITFCGTSVDRICKSEIFRNRKWNTINIHSGWYLLPFQHEHLNDQFLLEVVQNCKNCRITCEYEEALQFSIQGILQIFKNALELGKQPSWLFEHVPLGHLTMLEAETLFRELPNCIVEFNKTRDFSGRFWCKECKVSTVDTASLLLTVSIYDPNV